MDTHIALANTKCTLAEKKWNGEKQNLHLTKDLDTACVTLY